MSTKKEINLKIKAKDEGASSTLDKLKKKLKELNKDKSFSGLAKLGGVVSGVSAAFGGMAKAFN